MGSNSGNDEKRSDSGHILKIETKKNTLFDYMMYSIRVKDDANA